MTQPDCAEMSSPLSLTVTHTSTVTPDQIDELGHMNVRWYGLNAVAGSRALCARLGLGEPDLRSAYTRHHHEQMEGAELQVHSAVLGGTGRLRLYHELRNAADGDLGATFVHEIDHAGVEAPAIELPAHGRPRSLDLGVDRLANAPSIDELRSRGLQARLPRRVTTEDTMGADTVPSWLTNNLIWGGERPDGEESWIHTTDDGEQIAQATMESRLSIGRLPTVGTRIQSFSANLHVGDKITHDIGWAYDLETHEVLAVFEGIDLAFSIAKRRSTEFPPAMRDRELARCHPDLG